MFFVLAFLAVLGVGLLLEGLGHHERVVLAHERLHHFLEGVGF